MPWTFAHPATVLPLRRFCPVYLSFAGLAIGSMTPDLGYYIHLSGLAHLAHTFAGSILVCLPTGLALFAALYLLRRPFWFILPQPHRAAIEPVASFSTPRLFAAANSIVFGAWTHIFWDSFTHKNGWMVKHVIFLQKPAFRLGLMVFPTYQLLQYLSSLVGTVALVAGYCMWLRSRPLHLVRSRLRYELWRYVLLAAIVTTTAIIALPEAVESAASFEGYAAIRAFLVGAAVYGTAAFIPLLVVCSVLCYAVRREI